jgi:hypothetical protein
VLAESPSEAEDQSWAVMSTIAVTVATLVVPFLLKWYRGPPLLLRGCAAARVRYSPVTGVSCRVVSCRVVSCRVVLFVVFVVSGVLCAPGAS